MLLKYYRIHMLHENFSAEM